MTTSSYSSTTSTFTLYPTQHHPFPQERSRPSRPMRNLFNSVKEKLSGNSADSTAKSTSTTFQSSRTSNNPFISNTSTPAASSPRNTTSGTTPTRRPPPTEAPPAYTETPTLQTGPVYRGDAPHRSRLGFSAASLSNAEDPYEFLKKYDTIFVIDDSGSMAGRSWREVEDALRTLAPICTERDSDGIDVFFLNHKSSSPDMPSKGSAAGGYRGIADAAAVTRIFSAVRPGGGTPTGTCLYKILKPYLRLCAESGDVDKVRPINIIVITDGVPTDEVESVLVSAARKLDALDAHPSQVGVQFFQVGNEPDAAGALSKLDDDLSKQGIRDMVDTVSWTTTQGSTHILTADGILKAVLGAVIKRLDRLPTGGESRGNGQ